MCNALTVDVEDYFHTEAMSKTAPREFWDSMESRVERNTWVLLELFERHEVRTTMFFLGWVAERFPQLVKAAVAAGHEPGCHSYWHRPVCRLSPAEFREDTIRSKELIEAAGCKRVKGYRAPSFSLLSGMDWAYDVLTDLGFDYSSSCHPIPHDMFSNADAPRLPYRSKSGLLEIPITTWNIWNWNFPVGGGAYLRILPFSLVKAGLRHAHLAGETLMLYLHPWEIDTEQPRLSVGIKSRLRQYTGLGRTTDRLEHLLSLYRFVPADEAFGVEVGTGPAPGRKRVQTAMA